ncbi:MAG: tRNA (guanosine(46)-N7)-methyltransferase TrmB [Bdellovibrionales bacterium]|nr:tRNA (guanosine(46)-N7)-methyltransferase TrmB [Bdellovibrionales bacterium]
MLLSNKAVEAVEGKRWVNPYRRLLDQYPGRLLSFDSWDKDAEAVDRLLSGVSQAYCEIGSGSGRHLIEVARQHPQALLFGFELRFKRAVRTMEKSNDAGVHNTIVLRTKGEHLPLLFGPETLDGVYVNFPEPWDKLKRRKHRVLNVSLLEALQTRLKPGGFLSVKTDHSDYLRTFLAEASEFSAFQLVERSEDLHRSEWMAGNVPTEFEELFRHKGISVEYAKLLRVR